MDDLDYMGITALGARKTLLKEIAKLKRCVHGSGSGTSNNPNLNTNTPHDFPWIGEACSVSNDTCWQIEFLSRCEPTGDPDQPADAGMCILDCTESLCIDRDGTAPLMCAQTGEAEGSCLPFVSGYNDYCAAVPGTVSEHLDAWQSSRSGRVCPPHAWQ